VKFTKIKSIWKSFSITEKTIILLVVIVLCASGLTALYNLNQKFLQEIPLAGGSFKEGLVGSPRLINPLLATSDTDRSLTTLLYSGLIRYENDKLIPDLASKYEISDDLLEYKFYIKDDATFHDGSKVTSDDVIFTILSAQNPDLKSPLRSNWEGISIEKINDQEILFKLEKPYAPFLQNMTLGILPKHIWSQIDVKEFTLSNFNISPIGTGPYKVKEIRRDSIGIPTSYELTSFKDFTLGEPNIPKITFVFKRNQEEILEEYKNQKIDSVHSIDPKVAKGLQITGGQVLTSSLPRDFGLFFNQNQNPVLKNKSVREALELATPKNRIIDEVFFGFAKSVDGPVPSELLGDHSKTNYNLEQAMEKLALAGWTKNEDGKLVLVDGDEKQILSLSISTSNVSELKSIAEIVAEAWRELGAEVRVEIFEVADLNSNVIRPRKFETLLFEITSGRDYDYYPFWHSSQRNDPGLNITNYANIKVDDILEKIRDTEDLEIIKSELTEFNEEFKNDIPAIFIYSPDFIYLVPEKIKGVDIKNIISSEERFSNVYKWYIETDKVWPIFNKNNQ